jgi:hypothetical protein
VQVVKPRLAAYGSRVAVRARKRSNPVRIGRPKVFPDSQLYSLRIPKELHRQLQTHAQKDGRSMNVILLQVIEDWWMSLPEGKKYRRGEPGGE